MNLHEYQAKELLKKYNVPVQEGIPVDTAEKAVEAYKQLKGAPQAAPARKRAR